MLRPITNHFKNHLGLKKDMAVKTLNVTVTGHAPHPKSPLLYYMTNVEMGSAANRVHIKKIAKEGFTSSWSEGKLMRSNYGPGLELYNHPRCSLTWAYGPPIIVCTVDPALGEKKWDSGFHDQEDRYLLERFRCTLVGPRDMYRDSSYMLRDEPSLDKVRPIAVIDYELDMGSFKKRGAMMDKLHCYQMTNELHCAAKCNWNVGRCDCPQKPTILDDDVLIF